MGRYILRRLVISIPVLIGITIAVYFIVNMAPGDPVTAMIDPEAVVTLGPEWVEDQKKALGLDQPLPIRYGIWVSEVVRGNLGFSFNDRRPVSDKLAERIWPTLKLMLAAETIALVIGIPIGIMSALRQYSKGDYFATIFGFLAISVPSFFLALGSIYLFAILLGWLPTAGMGTLGQDSSLIDSLHHLILPASVLGLAQAAPLIRYSRSSMLEVLRQDYIHVARAKGLSERAIVARHAVRNALIPMVTVIALDLPRLLGGTIIIEQVFAWPGMGTLAISAVRGYDYPVIMAINLISAILILSSNLLADVLYAVIDPRIKYT